MVVMDLDKGDTSALLAAGFRFPEVFVAKGRDRQTDIWGIITRPMNFDPSKKYPVIENIYAGPQGSFVPKTFSAVAPDQPLAELGFGDHAPPIAWTPIVALFALIAVDPHAARAAPPAMTPVPGTAGMSSTRAAPNLPITAPWLYFAKSGESNSCSLISPV